MRTKRKRGTRKLPPKKPSLPAPQNEEACSNFVAQNTNPTSAHNASIPVEVDWSDSPGQSSASSDSDESFNVGDSSSDDSVIDRRPRKSAKARSKSIQLSKRKGSGNPNSASILPSSSRKQNPLGTPRHDSRYHTEELTAALAVVKKVMQMEEAQPFNVPVDPVALGRHDYYDIIHTPMDFGTISRNLQGGIKYVNASDIYSDVEHIWENCLKLYKKGEYIVYLMKLVKKKFMKYWTAAGLDSGQSIKSKGHSHLQPHVDSAQWHNQHVPGGSVDHITGGHHTEFQPQHTHLSSKQCSTQWMHQQRINLLELTTGVDTGHSHVQSHDSCMRCSEQFHRHSLDPMFVEASQLAPQPSHVSSHCLKEPSQLQPGCTQPLSSRVQANVVTENSNLSRTDSAMRGINCALRYTLAPATAQSSQENGYGLGPSESPRDQTPESQHQSSKCQQWAQESGSRRDPKRTKRKVRGVTRCIFLKNLEDGERIYVPINELGQPVGAEARKLTSFLGTIARNGHMAPLTYTKWNLVPKTFKEDIWQLVQTKFDIDSSCKLWVMQSIRDKWRTWKYYLKATYFDTHETDEERLKDRDRRILPEQWSYLVSYWNSDKAKKHSATNRAICKLRKMQHAAGTKSFARIREEEKQKRSDGKEPTRAELYILTHTRKDGQPVNETVAATIEKLREQASRKQNSAKCIDDENDTFCEVMGERRSDRLRAYGPGPEPAELRNIKPSHHEFIKMNQKVNMMSNKIEDLEQKYASIETQLALMNSNLQKFLEKMGGQSEEVLSTQLL